MSNIKILFLWIMIFLLILIIYGYLTIFVHNRVAPLAGNLKVGDFGKTYIIAKSTTLFQSFNYSRTSNSILSRYYMFGIDNIVKQDFNTAEKYCIVAKEKCSITSLYKEAKSYYCKDNSIEYMAYGYDNNQTEEYNKNKCIYSKKRLEEIMELGVKAYKLPSGYWIPRFR